MLTQRLSLCLLASLLLLTGCDAVKNLASPIAPEFRKLDNVNLSLEGMTLVLAADVTCYNPNAVGGKVNNFDLSVTVVEAFTGGVRETPELEIAALSEFTLPVQLSITPEDAIRNFGKLQQLFTQDSIPFTYQGGVDVTILGLTRHLNLKGSDAVKVK